MSGGDFYRRLAEEMKDKDPKLAKLAKLAKNVADSWVD